MQEISLLIQNSRSEQLLFKLFWIFQEGTFLYLFVLQRLWFFSKHLGPIRQYEFCDVKCNKKQKVSFLSQLQSWDVLQEKQVIHTVQKSLFDIILETEWCVYACFFVQKPIKILHFENLSKFSVSFTSHKVILKK